MNLLLLGRRVKTDYLLMKVRHLSRRISDHGSLGRRLSSAMREASNPAGKPSYRFLRRGPGGIYVVSPTTLRIARGPIR